MSLIESFFILFKTDADKVTAELDKAEASADGLSDALDSVGKVDTSGVQKIAPAVEKSVPPAKNLNRELTKAELKAKELGSSFMGVVKGLAAPLVALASIGGAVAAATSRAGEIEGIGKAAADARVAVGDFDAFGRAARNMGGEVSGANADLKTLADKALEAASKKGGEASQAFRALGVSVKEKNGHLKDTSKLMLELAASTEKMAKPKAEERLKNLGITDPGTIKLIMSGKQALQEYIDKQKKSAEITQEQVEASKAYKEAQNELSDSIGGLSNELVTLLVPAITTVIKWVSSFAQWCRENKNVVVIFFGAITAAALVYAAAMGVVSAETLLALAPFLAIAAACAAFALVLDDVLAYLNGQPSVLGELAAKYPVVAEALKLIGEAWEWVKSKAEPVIDYLKAVWGMVVSLWKGDIDGFKQHFWDAVNAIKVFWIGLWNDLVNVGGKVGDLIWEPLKKGFEIAKEWIKTQWHDFIESLWNMLPGWARRWLGGEGDKERADREKKEADDKQHADNYEASQKKLYEGHYPEPDKPTALPPQTRKAVQIGQAQIQTASENSIPPNGPAASAAGGGEVTKKVETNNNVEASVVINVEGMSAAEVEALVQKTSAATWKRELAKASSGADNGVAR